MHHQVYGYNDAQNKKVTHWIIRGCADSLVFSPNTAPTYGGFKTRSTRSLLTWKTRQKMLAPLRLDGDLPRRQKEGGKRPRGRGVGGGGEDGTDPEALWNSEFKAGRRNRLTETEGGGHAAPRGDDGGSR